MVSIAHGFIWIVRRETVSPFVMALINGVYEGTSAPDHEVAAQKVQFLARSLIDSVRAWEKHDRLVRRYSVLREEHKRAHPLISVCCVKRNLLLGPVRIAFIHRFRYDIQNSGIVPVQILECSEHLIGNRLLFCVVTKPK